MKYVGSKNKLAKYIIPILQKIIDDNKIDTYYEPFAGGFNVIDKIKCKNRIGNDIDDLPINLIRASLNENLLNELLELPSKEHYYDVRDNPEKYSKGYRSAILLFGSYNARVYGGCYGAYAKTKDGNIRNYFQEAKRNFEKQLTELAFIKLSNKDYLDIDMTKAKNILIYCDPPYSEGIGYKTKFNSDEFWDWAREQSKNNIVVISEYNAPDDFKCIWQKEVKSHMNNRNKLNMTEKLFTYNKI